MADPAVIPFPSVFRMFAYEKQATPDEPPTGKQPSKQGPTPKFVFRQQRGFDRAEFEQIPAADADPEDKVTLWAVRLKLRPDVAATEHLNATPLYPVLIRETKDSMHWIFNTKNLSEKPTAQAFYGWKPANRPDQQQVQELPSWDNDDEEVKDLHMDVYFGGSRPISQLIGKKTKTSAGEAYRAKLERAKRVEFGKKVEEAERLRHKRKAAAEPTLALAPPVQPHEETPTGSPRGSPAPSENEAEDADVLGNMATPPQKRPTQGGKQPRHPYAAKQPRAPVRAPPTDEQDPLADEEDRCVLRNAQGVLEAAEPLHKNFEQIMSLLYDLKLNAKKSHVQKDMTPEEAQRIIELELELQRLASHFTSITGGFLNALGRIIHRDISTWHIIQLKEFNSAGGLKPLKTKNELKRFTKPTKLRKLMQRS